MELMATAPLESINMELVVGLPVMDVERRNSKAPKAL
jgi:hypothetical protein